MQVTFFGTRGSCPCAGEEYAGFGGNTACVLVRVGDDPPLILDLGTGLRPLGAWMERELPQYSDPLRATALLTHLHFDHILGLPFFGPLRHVDSVLDVYGPRQADGPLTDVVPRVVQPPFFPVHLQDLRGKIHFHDTGDEDFGIGSAKIRARWVPHMGQTLGYRVEADGASLAYLPDHQAPADRRSLTAGVLELCDRADVLVHDAQYSEEEFAQKADWGHSTVGYAVAVAAQARVRRLVLFHHDPAHGDRAVERLLEMARAMQPVCSMEITAAREGATIDVGRR